MKSKSLFSEFDPVSAKAFKQKIQFDLKGADYNDTLLWQSPEGITVKPFYHRDDAPTINTIPNPDQWHIGEALFIHDIDKTLYLIKQAINGGAEAIILKADAPFDAKTLLKKLATPTVSLHFYLDFLDISFYKNLYNTLQKQGYTGTIYLDTIGHLAKEGNWYHNLKKDQDILQQVVEEKISTPSIDLSLYENAGGNTIQQLAYALAHANEYLNLLDGKTKDFSIHFNLSIGHNYFFEIAKIRALKLLYNSIAKEYGITNTCTITASPSFRNKTIYDYNTNMLRTTTECMSAVLGGADIIVNQPYDAIYHKTNDFGQRISRNQLLILKKESYFDAVSNPAEGAYYIEDITQQLAQKALELFKNIEQGGGFLKQLKAGTIQRKLKESAQKEQEQFDKQERILLGTNKHPNPDDKMKDNLELYPFVKTKPRKTLIAPIIPRRLAQTIEQERLDQEV